MKLALKVVSLAVAAVLCFTPTAVDAKAVAAECPEDACIGSCTNGDAEMYCRQLDSSCTPAMCHPCYGCWGNFDNHIFCMES